VFGGYRVRGCQVVAFLFVISADAYQFRGPTSILRRTEHLMAGRQRGTFEKRRREIDRQEKQAEKRARRQDKRRRPDGLSDAVERGEYDDVSAAPVPETRVPVPSRGQPCRDDEGSVA
jgi:hypothetical protein